MVPEQARQILEPLMESGIPWDDITVHVGRLPGASLVPHALVPRRAMAVTAAGVARALKTVGLTIRRDVWLDRQHADFKSAAGLSLLGHELVHVTQYERDPDFSRNYDSAARRTPGDRPWENPYEAEAYLEERRLYCTLVAQGWPRGPWVPLGVSLWGCG